MIMRERYSNDYIRKGTQMITRGRYSNDYEGMGYNDYEGRVL